ncbi:MAG: hypothetical protein LBF86_06430 [Helicobacteraceae bacterium]|jgi:hypothetical protein|nr:hypothetical protein [Helicobacteraceae bacterium]
MRLIDMLNRPMTIKNARQGYFVIFGEAVVDSDIVGFKRPTYESRKINGAIKVSPFYAAHSFLPWENAHIQPNAIVVGV